MVVIDLTHDDASNTAEIHEEEIPSIAVVPTVLIPAMFGLPQKRKRTPKGKNKVPVSKRVSKSKAVQKSSKSTVPPKGYCVCGIDIGLKNFSLAVLQQNEINETTQKPTRPTILAWQNTNLYADRVGGKIIKYEAADKLIQRINTHLDTVGASLSDGWHQVNQVCIESQSASTNAIKRVETIVFAYFVFKHPHIEVKTISASCKLKLDGMTHTKDDVASYKDRKNLSIKYARQYMQAAPDDCPYKHILDPLPRQPRKKKGEIRATSTASSDIKRDDLSDSLIQSLYVLGVSITQCSSMVA